MLTLAALRHRSHRLLAAGLAVLLGVAFGSAVLVLGASLRASLADRVGGEMRERAAVVAPTRDTELEPAHVRALRAVPGATVHVVSVGYGMLDGAWVTTVSAPAHDAHVRAGRLPARAGEAAITPALQERGVARVGDRVTFEQGEGRTRTLDVVGVAEAPVMQGGAGVPGLVLTEEEMARTDAHAVRVDVDGDGARVLPAVRSAVPDLRSMSGQEAVDSAVQDLAHGTAALTAILSAFPLIALAVAAMVITNTFRILVAQRARELGLLRLVGAERAQVLRSVLGEALALGLLASVLGVLLGIAAVASVPSLSFGTGPDLELTHLKVTPRAVLVPLAVGTVVTVLSALRPAWHAGRVTPLAALQPVPEPTLRGRGGWARLATGVLLAGPGTAVLVALSLGHRLLPAVLAGLVSVVGVVVLAPYLVPPCVAGLARLLRRGGVPAALAGGNALRDRSRTAATASALLIGVTLVVMIVTGVGSVRATTGAMLDKEMPVDVELVSGKALSTATLDRVREVPAVASVAPVRSVEAEAGDGRHVSLSAADPDQVRAVARDAEAAPAARPGVLLVPPDELADWTEGQRVRLTTPRGTVGLTVHAGTGRTWYMSSADARTLDPAAEPSGALLRLKDGADAEGALADISKATSGTGTQVAGAAATRASMEKDLDLLLGIVVGLLAVAVVIAVVGIANTLSLAVLERSRESALLRSLGLTRGQLRAMVALEAGLVGVVAALLGAGLGIGYGFLGVVAAARGDMEVVLDVPVTRVLLVLAVAVAAALLAGVLPAWRAARVPPVRALAAD